MRTDPMGKFCHPEKRSVVGQCEGVCRSIAFVRDDALYGKMQNPVRVYSDGVSGAQDRSRTCTPLDTRT